MHYPVHKIVHPREHPFSVHLAGDSAPFLLEHHYQTSERRDTAVDHPGSVGPQLRKAAGLVVLLSWPPGDVGPSKAFRRKRGLIRPDNLVPLLRLPVCVLGCPHHARLLLCFCQPRLGGGDAAPIRFFPERCHQGIPAGCDAFQLSLSLVDHPTVSSIESRASNIESRASNETLLNVVGNGRSSTGGLLWYLRPGPEHRLDCRSRQSYARGYQLCRLEQIMECEDAAALLVRQSGPWTAGRIPAAFRWS